MSKATETKSQRFRRLATARVNRAIKDLRSIGNLSNRSAYEYSPTEVQKIMRSLRDELKDLENRFSGSESKNRQFTL